MKLAPGFLPQRRLGFNFKDLISFWTGGHYSFKSSGTNGSQK